MSDSLILYRTIVDLMQNLGVHFHDIRCLLTFGWAIVGVLMEQRVHVSKWGLHRPSEAAAASKQRQFVRWLRNPKIKVAEIYRRLARAALAEWQGTTLYLALDSSSLWNRFVLVRVALIYRGRALPLSWVVVAQASTSVAFEQYQAILKEAAAILPKGCRRILLADRGFDDVALLRAARDLGWGFRIRLKRSLRVHRAAKPSLPIGRLMPATGRALFLHKIWITDRQFGPVHLALAHVHTAKGEEEWAILSDEPTTLHTFDEYGLRFDLEENFLDDKSAGFQLESSELRNAAALTRLGLILATATLYVVSTGTAAVTLAWRTQVDPHWQRGLSYFQIGWRWVRHALALRDYLLPFFWLEPEPDPAPVFASNRQRAAPGPMLFEIRLEVT